MSGVPIGDRRERQDVPTSTRRLVAILLADVVGYSRLMQTDEAATLRDLKEQQNTLVGPTIAAHDGRIVNAPGDSMLVEFASVVNAVQAAIDIQRGMRALNHARPEDRRMQLRIGINLGDVISDGGQLYGDDVNLAARLETLAQPGCILISETVYSHVRERMPFKFEDAGQHQVKNFARPVRAYRVDAQDPPDPLATPRIASTEAPKILVLPFVNMSGEAEQEVFADGLSEDIITELSRFRHLFVISRNSAFKYKGEAVQLRQVARQLGVQYVIEGSVRKAGDRVRVTVQLIDGEVDRHLWAERYDRRLDDIFAIQDEITAAIVATLPGRVEAASRERFGRKPTDSMAAYECVLAGKLLHHHSTKADNAKALALLERAIALDPNYAHAHAWKACVLGQAWVNGYCEDRDATFAQVGEELQTALQLDDNDSDVHRIFAAVTLVHRDYAKAEYHQRRALSLNPNDDLIVVQQGEFLTWFGEPEEGAKWVEKAMRLNPYHPERFWSHLGRAFFVARRYGDAISAFGHISAPDHLYHAFLAASHAMLGDDLASRKHAAEVLRQHPAFCIEAHMPTLHYKRAEDRDHHRAALERAGLPATPLDGASKPSEILAGWQRGFR